MKLLVAIARPMGYNSPNNDWQSISEIPYRDIEATLDSLKAIPREFEVHVLMGASLEKLSTTLLHDKYDGLHLICHGSEDGHLLFEDEEMGARLVNGKEFFDALSGTDIRLLTLSACHGQAAIQDHLPSNMTVLAVNPCHAVFVRSAHTFFDAFYSLLLKGQSASEAFSHAEKKPNLDGLVGDEVPKDLFRLLCDNGGTFATNAGKANFTWLQEPPTHWFDPELPALGTFVGRSKETFELVHALSPAPVGIRGVKAPIVVLHSSGGTGKTTLARKVCQRLHEDRRFQGGIYELAALGKTSGPVLAEKLFKALGAETPKAEFPEQLLVLQDLIRACSNDRETLFFLDNMEEAFRSENPDRGNVVQLLGALVQAHDGVRVLATSQMESGVSDKKLVQHVGLEDFLKEETWDFLAERIELIEEEPDDQQLQEYGDLFQTLHSTTGGHPLSLFLVMSQFERFLEEEGGKLEALNVMVTQLAKDFVGTLRSSDPTLPDRHLSIQECLQFTLSLLDEDARQLFLHLCLFPAGLTWNPPDFLKKFIGFREDAYNYLHVAALIKIAGEKPARRFVLIQPALRQTGESLLLQVQPEKKKDLVELYTNWLEELEPGVTNGKFVDEELENCLGLLLGRDISEAFTLYYSIRNHFKHIEKIPDLVDHTKTFIAYQRKSLTSKSDYSYHDNLAGDLSNLGNLLSNLGRNEEALEATQEALDIRRRIAKAKPDAFLPSLAGCLNNLGNRLSDLGRHEEALNPAQEALDIRKRLTKARPDAFLPELATNHNNLGKILSDLGRHKEALDHGKEALGIRRRLAQARPDAFLPDLAGSLNNLGRALFELGRHEEALDATKEAIGIRRHLAQARPDVFLPDLAGSLNNLGNILSELGQPEEACAHFLEALKTITPFHQRYPEAFEGRMTIIAINIRENCPELYKELSEGKDIEEEKK